MATPFKMKSSPAQGRLGDFFKGIGSKRRARKDEESYQKNIETKNKAAKASTAADNKEKSQKPTKKNELPKGTGSNAKSYNVGESKNDKIAKPRNEAGDKNYKNSVKTKSKVKVRTAAKVSADKSVGVKKTDKVDHNKGLKGKHGAERRKYYDKHKLKYDKTISFGPDLKSKGKANATMTKTKRK